METDSRKPRRTPRGQGKLLRERLIEAALAMIDDGRAEGTSIRAVTRRAGVSPTAFYLHFETREELMEACVERSFADFRDALREAATSVDDPRGRLLQSGLAYIEFAGARPERYALIFEAPPRAPTDKSKRHDLNGRPVPASDAFNDLVELVRGYMGDAAPAREEAETLAKGIWAGLHGYVMLRRIRPAIGWPDEKEFTSRLASAWLEWPAAN